MRNFEYKEEVPEEEGHHRIYSIQNGIKEVEIWNDKLGVLETKVLENLRTHESLIMEFDTKGETKEVVHRTPDGVVEYIDLAAWNQAKKADPIGSMFEAIETEDWSGLPTEALGRPRFLEEAEVSMLLKELDDIPPGKGH